MFATNENTCQNILRLGNPSGNQSVSGHCLISDLTQRLKNDSQRNLYLGIMVWYLFCRIPQGCQMVPNLANVAKNHCFAKILPMFFGNIFLMPKFAIFQIPGVFINFNKIYEINIQTLESAAQIICLNMIYCLRKCC